MQKLSCFSHQEKAWLQEPRQLLRLWHQVKSKVPNQILEQAHQWTPPAGSSP